MNKENNEIEVQLKIVESYESLELTKAALISNDGEECLEKMLREFGIPAKNFEGRSFGKVI